MAVKYYVKNRETLAIVRTCETSEQAQKEAKALGAKTHGVFLSDDAVELYKAKAKERKNGR